MTTIAVVGIPPETTWLCRRLHGAAVENSPVGSTYRGQWQAQDLIVVQCGVGKISASAAMQRLIDRHAPQAILNVGSAGAIAPELRVGDIVIASQIVPYDAGVFLQRGYVCTGNALPLRAERHWRVFPCDPRLVGLARDAASRSLAGQASHHTAARVWLGPIASGDQVVFADGPKQWLHRTFGALAVENEGAAVAQVAAAHGVPWLAVRGISDTADAAAAFDYAPLLRYADEPAGWLGWARFQRRRLVHLIRNPRTRANRRRFEAGVRRVNGSLEGFLDALLPLL